MTHIIDKYIDRTRDTAVMLGNFDGLHIGHQKLLSALKAAAQTARLETVVLSFFPHPVSVLKNKMVQTIYTSGEKAFLLEQAGVDVFLEYPFDQAFARYTPETFVTDVLAGRLRCKTVIVGEGYRFGAEQAGNSDTLFALGAVHGINVIVTPLVRLDGEKVSASGIRDDIRDVRFAEAEAKLGRPYFVQGAVEAGKRLGRSLGFPTANVLADPYKLLPPDGVYATETLYGGNLYKSVTNVGMSPTVDGDRARVVETFMTGFDRDIYGETVQVNFKRWLRGEVKFDSLDALKAQISRDVREGLS